MLSETKSSQAGKKLIQILFFFFLVSQFCFAQWVQSSVGLPTSPASGVYALTCLNPYVFAGDSGVFRTADNGMTWDPVNNGLNTITIYSLTTIGNDIFATTGLGVFLSTDYGESWISRSNGLPTNNTSINCLITSGDNIFVGCSAFGVYFSSNYGINWIEVNNGLPAGCSVYSMAALGTVLFAGVWGTGVFVSTDSGSTWVEKTSGITIPQFYCFTVSGTYVYVGTNVGVFRTTNNGDDWVEVNNGLTNTVIRSFAISASNILAGTWGGGIFLTQNNGSNWYDFNAGFTYYMTITSMTVSDNYLFAGTLGGGGVWRRPLSDISDVIDESFPVEFQLRQNYPNPFNPSTKISWQSPVGSWQTLKIYDVLGNEVATLVDEYKPAGSYED